MTVYLVGAGPGAPDLLTVRALCLLQRADVVLYDALVHPDTVALATRARKISVGKRCGRDSMRQETIVRLLLTHAATCEVVVRLKGGDPMLFARAAEEIEALRAANVACEVVPGITAASAASAALRIPLTRRGDVRSVTLFTPVQADGGLDLSTLRIAARSAAGALYMGAHVANRVAAALVACGKPATTPVAVVESVSLPDQRARFTTLADLATATYRRSTPTIVLFGPQFTGAQAGSGGDVVAAERAAMEHAVRHVACL